MRIFEVIIVLQLLGQFAAAQVAVYRGDFDSVGNSINFVFFERVYLVADLSAGTGSFLFLDVNTSGNSVSRQYVEAPDAANIFVAVKRERSGTKVRKLVMRAISDSGTAQSYYLAVGDLDTTISGKISQLPVSSKTAKNLRGHVLTSDDESDMELPLDAGLGLAGAAEFNLSLQRNQTQIANNRGSSVAEVMADLVTGLETAGFTAVGEEETGETTESTDTTATTTTTTTTS